MAKTDSEVQSERDREAIRIKLIDNGFLLKAGVGEVFQPDEDSLFEAIRARIKSLKAKRAAA